MSRPEHRIAVTVVVSAVALPFVPLILWAFSQRWFYPAPWPQEWSVRAWRYLYHTSGSQIAGALVESLRVSGVTAVLSVVVAFPAGRVLGLRDFRGKDLVGVVLALPVIVPPLCVAMGLHLWFLRLGLADTFAGVVLVHLTFCLPYAVFVLWGAFANYNREFEDQARSLGASALRTVFAVTLPMVAPGAVVAGLFCFLLSWSQYLSTLIIGGGEVTTLPILLFALMGSGDRPVAAAVSLLFVAPAFTALLVSTRTLSGEGLRGIR